MNKRTHKSFWAVFFILLIAMLTVVAIATIQIVEYSKVDDKQNADCIIVLGAGTAEGQVSAVFRERLNHGITLLNQGYGKKIILTGGIGKGNAVSDSRVARDYLVSCGVATEDIYIEEKSTITEENLINAKEIMDEKGFKTAIIVSDPLHMKRAHIIAADLGIEAYVSPTPTSMYRSSFTKIEFLAREVFYYIGYYAVKPFR